MEDGDWNLVKQFFYNTGSAQNPLVILKMASETQPNQVTIEPNHFLLIGHSYYNLANNQPHMFEWLRQTVWQLQQAGQDPQAKLAGLTMNMAQELEKKYRTRFSFRLDAVQTVTQEAYNDAFRQVEQTIVDGQGQATPDQPRLVVVPSDLEIPVTDDGQPGFTIATCYSPDRNLDDENRLFSHRILATFSLASASVEAVTPLSPPLV